MVKKEGQMIKKGNVLVIVLILLLIGAVGFIAYDKYSTYQSEQQFGIYQQGAQFGYQQAIIQLAQNVATCQPVPITVSNQTFNVVALECYEQQAPTQ